MGINHINEIMHDHLLASPIQNIIVSIIAELGICYYTLHHLRVVPPGVI